MGVFMLIWKRRAVLVLLSSLVAFTSDLQAKITVVQVERAKQFTGMPIDGSPNIVKASDGETVLVVTLSSPWIKSRKTS